jgi:hypothetical protein
MMLDRGKWRASVNVVRGSSLAVIRCDNEKIAVGLDVAPVEQPAYLA